MTRVDPAFPSFEPHQSTPATDRRRVFYFECLLFDHVLVPPLTAGASRQTSRSAITCTVVDRSLCPDEEVCAQCLRHAIPISRFLDLVQAERQRSSSSCAGMVARHRSSCSQKYGSLSSHAAVIRYLTVAGVGSSIHGLRWHPILMP